MAMLPNVFKPSDIEDDMLLEDGIYTLEVVKSDMKDTKKGDGKYLALTYKVTESDDDNKDAGRVVFANINLVNPNPVAVKIAEKEFKNLCDALNLTEVEDSQELHGIPFVASIGTRAGGDFDDSNYITKYHQTD